MKRRQKKHKIQSFGLWGIVDGEPYLMGGGEPFEEEFDGELYFGKWIYTDSNGRNRLVLANPPTRWERIDSKSYVVVDDIARHLKCTTRTIQNYIRRGHL